ncbi:ribulose-phosphate 3-epimerase [Akkermansiaceae bacterium]|nr:ribulose-phosphate 3-epimerase [Akkermansiaceae bacterium]MDB4502675.1 ribulose-phosphate 3-epimerase [Akkermansiaceae bacterium]MDB4510840.1 ribulose-phosphate 3-epimerase [Akkermansiaceae bacterium]
MTRAEKLDLIRSRPQLSVATLSADMGNQNAALQTLKENDVNLLHFDVMDGNIWPNITVGSPFVAGLKTDLLKDVHLLINKPKQHIDSFAKAGADLISFSVEYTAHIDDTLSRISTHEDILRGVSLNPDTSPSFIKNHLDQIDYVLLLGVGPYSGKELFLDDIPAKIKTLLEWKPELLICIDGGVNKTTIPEIAVMKPHFVVSGSAIFNNEDPVENLAFFNNAISA